MIEKIRGEVKVPDKLYERYEVILVEDGSILETCKSIKLNLKEILKNYQARRQEDAKVSYQRE